MNSNINVKNKLIQFFLFLFILDPTLYVIFFSYFTGLDILLYVLKVAIVLVLLIVGSVTYSFLKNTSRLQTILNSIENSCSGEDKHFLEIYPKKAALYLFLGNVIGPILFNGIIYFNTHVHNSITQMIYYVLIGASTALIVSLQMYYYSRNIIHRATIGVNINRITIFEKVTIPFLNTLTFIITFLLIVLYSKMLQMHTESLDNISHQTTKAVANRIQALLEVSLDEVRALSTVYRSSIILKDFSLSRAESTAILKHYLENNANSNSLKVWTIFEPNKFDGKDDRLKAGRYICSWVRDSNNKISFSLPENYEDPGKGHYYQLVKQRKKESITEPYPITIDQKEVFIITLSAPVLDREGNFYGAIGVDIALSSLSEVISKETVYGDGYITLLSGERNIVSTQNKNLIGKNLLEIYKDSPEIYNKVKNAGEYSFVNISKLANKKIYNRGTSILIGNTEVEWKSAVSIPIENLQGPLDFLTWLFIFSGMTAIIAVLVISYLSIKPISSSLNQFLEIFSKGMQGDLTTMHESKNALTMELTSLSAYFNEFMKKIGATIKIIMNSSSKINGSMNLFSNLSQRLSSNSNRQSESILNVSTALNNITSISGTITDNSHSQSLVSNETYKAIDLLQSQIKNIFNKAEEALHVNLEATNLAEKGNELMQSVIDRMNKINESTKKIADTITVIQEISDQVNLLSLNASIEAARAGEHGRGFSVVASEIGKLAEHTAVNAKNITGYVRNGLIEAERGKELVDSSSKSLKQIIEAINQSKNIVYNITIYTKEQETEVNRIVENSKKIKETSESTMFLTESQKKTNEELQSSIHNIKEVTNTVIINADEISNTVKEIKEFTNQMNHQIEFFKV